MAAHVSDSFEDINTNNQTPTDLPILSNSLTHTSSRSHHHLSPHHYHTSGRPEDDPKHGGSMITKTSDDDELQYPEGGRQAWTVVLGSCVSMVASFGVMNSIGTLQAHLSENQLAGHTQGQIGWIFGMYSFLSFFGGIQIGPIFDAFGPRWLLVAGTACLVVGLMLFSVSTQYWQFMMTFGVLSGIGTSLIFTPAVASVGHWFLKRRAYATGVATTGGSIGGIVFPLVIQAAMPAVGFGWAIRIVGFIVLTFLLIGNCLVQARTSVMNGTTSSSTSMYSKGEDGSTTTAAAADPEKPRERQSELTRAFSSVKIDLGAFLDPRFTFTTIGVFMIEWAVFVPITYITSYCLSLGLPSAFSYQMLAVLNIGSVFGRWLPGVFADRMGRFNIMLVTCSFCMITVLCFWLPTDYVPEIVGRKAIMVVFCLLYGFGSGSGISLTPVCVGQICSTKEYGTKYGTCYFFVSFATLTGVPIAGQIVAASGGKYFGLVLFTAASYVGAITFFGAARQVGLKHAGRVAGWRGIY